MDFEELTLIAYRAIEIFEILFYIGCYSAWRLLIMDANIPNFQLNLELSIEQKFTMRIFQESVKNMNPEDARSLLLEASQLLMVKDNIIRGLMKQTIIE